MARDRVSRLIAVALLCFLFGCGAGLRPPVSEPKPSSDSFLLQLNDGHIGALLVAQFLGLASTFLRLASGVHYGHFGNEPQIVSLDLLFDFQRQK